MRTVSNRVEFAIKKYIYDNRLLNGPKGKFTIAQANNVLYQGYYMNDNKRDLAVLIKKSKIHYPTPEEIENNLTRLREQDERWRKVNKPYYKKPSKLIKIRKNTLKKVLEIKEKDGIL